jgi:type II secretory pathway pseudopilin PulG
MTLIEVIVALVIISAAGATIIGLMASISRNSAATLAATQRANIAKAYLDEALAQDVCASAPSNRSSFNCVNNYNLGPQAVTDRFENLILGFDDYAVRVTVGVAGIPGVPGAEQRLVQVRVTDPFDPNNFTVLSGIRTRHP